MTRTTRRSSWHAYQSRVAYENKCRNYHPRFGWAGGFDVEVYVRDCLKNYDEQTRDGKNHEGSSKRAYKHSTDKQIRVNTREKLKKVVDNVEEYDYLIFDDKHTSKFLAWMIW